MRILLDLNVLIDITCRWEDFPESLQLYNRIVSDPQIEGAFPVCGYTTFYYIVKQLISEERTRLVLVNFQRRLISLPFDEKVITTAHQIPIKDLEDACIAATAYEGRCDVIATRNIKGFISSPVVAKTPAEILSSVLNQPGQPGYCL